MTTPALLKIPALLFHYGNIDFEIIRQWLFQKAAIITGLFG
jgi:hypothetical protein